MNDVQIVEHLKQRFLSWKQEGFPKADRNMIPILEELNRRPGVATVWHCCSHPEKGEGHGTTGYISLAVTMENYDVLRLLQYFFNPTRWRSFNVEVFPVEIETQTSCIFEKVIEGMPNFFGTFIFRWHTIDPIDRDMFINVFYNAVRTLIPER